MQFSDLVTTCTLTPAMTKQLASAFKTLPGASITYTVEYRNKSRYPIQSEAHERAYFALCHYAANAVAELFDAPGGHELHEQLMSVISEKYQGLLIKGLPKDTTSKTLVILGIKTLLADTHRQKSSINIPQRIMRFPAQDYLRFHPDGNPNFSDDSKSFLFMASAQPWKLTAPTLFKWKEAPAEEHVRHKLSPDELLIVNNKTLEHATGKAPIFVDMIPRFLIRYTIDNSNLSHTQDYMEKTRGLWDEGNIPEDQARLKQWLKNEFSTLKTGRSMVS